MKKLFLLLLLGLITTGLSAQYRKVELSHYIFPEFLPGNVLMKTGNVNSARLNYNSLTEEMIFDSNGKKLAIGPVEQVDTIYVDGRKFFPLEGKFVEIIYHNRYDLYACHKCTVVDPGKPAAYGGTSQTSSTTSYSSISAGGQVYELSLPDGYTTKPYTEYWLKKEGKLTHVITLRQLSKQFDSQSDQFKKYVKENRPNFEDLQSIIDLVKFMEQ